MPQIYPAPQTADIDVIFDSSLRDLHHISSLRGSEATEAIHNKNIDCHENSSEFSRNDNDRLYCYENPMDSIAMTKEFYKTHKYLPNLTICINDGVGNFGALIIDSIADNHLFPQTQCFPLYYYEKIKNDDSQKSQSTLLDSHHLSSLRGSEATEAIHNKNIDCHENPSGFSRNDKSIATYRRKDAIRDEALNEICQIYKDKSITKEAIFYYIYALLNHKGYKEKYKDNLSKMLPRIPFVRDFWTFENLGRKLAHLHLNYENFSEDSRALAIPKSQISAFAGIFGAESSAKKNAKIAMESLNQDDFVLKKMAFEKKGKKDTIIFNDKIAIINVPSKAYDFVVNGKSAIEWIIERYQVKIDKDSEIKNDPNLYESPSGALSGLKGGKYALNLLLSVIEMSAQSVEIIEQISALDLQEVK